MPIAVLIPLLVAMVFAVMLSFAAATGARRRNLLHEWQTAAQAAGCRVQRVSADESRAQVLIEETPTYANLRAQMENKHLVHRSIIWAKSASIPKHLSLHRDTGLRVVARWMEGNETRIGDADFDGLVELPAIDAHICAALSAKAREQVSELIRGWGGSVRDGMVMSNSVWSLERNSSFAPLMRGVASLTRLLSVPPEEVAQRLAQNALKDPIPAVQLQNLRYLVAPETQAPPELIAGTVRPLLAHLYPRLRLLAAQHAGREGRAVLLALATGEAVDLALRIEAARSLGMPSEQQDVEGLRSVLVDSAPPELLHAALCAIAPTSNASLLEAVQRCARHEHDSVRAAAARALGVLADPSTEPLLLALLADPSADVQQCSAEALGLFGSIAAVEPLLPLAETLVRPRLRQAARGAIGRIQSRLGDVEAGRLTLSDPDDLAGALDIAEASAELRAGELSLAEEPALGASPRPRQRP